MHGNNQETERVESRVTDREIISTRVFEAPRDLVFQAWVDPEQLKLWWGPEGFTNTFHEFDLKPGGIWQFIMHGPDGTDYRNKSVFVEIAPPERIVFDHVSGHFFRATILFEDLGNNRTRIEWHMLFNSAAEFDRVKSLVVEGNQQNLDKLEAHLKTM